MYTETCFKGCAAGERWIHVTREKRRKERLLWFCNGLENYWKTQNAVIYLSRVPPIKKITLGVIKERENKVAKHNL